MGEKQCEHPFEGLSTVQCSQCWATLTTPEVYDSAYQALAHSRSQPAPSPPPAPASTPHE